MSDDCTCVPSWLTGRTLQDIDCPTHEKEQTMSDKFDHITQNFYGTPERKRQAANGPTAAGALLILLATLSLIVWGFGADRFLWIATGAGGAGVVLLLIGAVMSKRKR